VGRFEKYVYSNGAWSDVAHGSTWLSVEIHDSDIATVEFSPSNQGHGRFYLGFHPSDYFEDPSASGEVDNALESAALAKWVDSVIGTGIVPAAILPHLASKGDEEPIDVFVEDTVVRLLLILGLLIPEDLEASE